MVDRKVRARAKLASPFVENDDPCIAAIARGIVQHHEDDHWFHQTRAFAELSLQFTVAIRELLSPDNGFRPSFLGHILVELLLDATLIAEEPQRLDAYYRAMEQLDPATVGAAVNQMATGDVPRLPELIPRFLSERFLCDYADDEKLLFRLNQVMQRVRLPELPPEFCQVLPPARRAVERRFDELLPTADAACQ